jgi:hypothetical protein
LLRTGDWQQDASHDLHSVADRVHTLVGAAFGNWMTTACSINRHQRFPVRTSMPAMGAWLGWPRLPRNLLFNGEFELVPLAGT